MLTQEENNISVVLNEKRIFIINNNISKTDLIASLVNAACDEQPSIDKEEILSVVLKREQGISTTLDTGLSIPHARIDDLNSFEAAAAVLPRAITDEYGLQIKVMFFFLSPSGSVFFPQHLRLLAMLAKKFSVSFINELVLCADKKEIVRKILF
ncbi:MAG: PTS sugar transporter subunit IIA [Elusimicrobiota bacterium]|jgi:PTS system nitrogen regulatory IIA component|nr:PTS sugar transporter subunit IIA [Elusimicrobiota bacterium]